MEAAGGGGEGVVGVLGLSRPPHKPNPITQHTPPHPLHHTYTHSARIPPPHTHTPSLHPPPLVSVVTAKPEVTVKLVCR